MELITVYLVLMLIGDAIDFGIGYAVSVMWSDQASLPIFLACYFLTLWVAWILALKITQPRAKNRTQV
jgi:hypothetical protein